MPLEYNCLNVFNNYILACDSRIMKVRDRDNVKQLQDYYILAHFLLNLMLKSFVVKLVWNTKRQFYVDTPHAEMRS